MKLNLAQKLVLVIEVVVVLFAGLGGVATYAILQKSLTARTQAQLESISVLKEGAVKEYVGHAKSEIEFYAKAQRSGDMLRSTIRAQKGTKPNEAKGLFSEIIKDGHTFRDVMLLDLQGEVILSSNLQDEGKIKDLEAMTGEFYHDVTINETAMVVSVPIEGKDGERMGVLAARLGIDEISKLMIERSGLGETGETFIVNSSNVVVTELLKEPGLTLKKTLFLPQITLCLAGESNFKGKVDYMGDSVFGYWKWFPEIRSCLVTKMDRSEALAPITEATMILLGMVGVIGVMVGLFGYGVGRSITKPLGHLRDEANKIKQGDFEVEVKIETGDEIEEVALAFNEMTKKLKEIYAGLEDKVKEKTEELTSKLKEMEGLNGALSENKSAILNLLEDSRSLEEQLKVEKAGVEKKVDERTRELSEERAELLAVINSISRGLIVVDKSWKVILENETIGKLMDIKDKVNYLDVVEYLREVIDLNKMVAESFLQNREVKMEAKLIGARYLTIHTVPVMHQEIVGAVAIFVQDVTEAMTIQRSKDEFFSIASHELRTPLTAIRGNTSMMLDYYGEAFKDPELKQMLTDTHDASIRLIGIVNDFLDMSRLEQGKMQYTVTQVKIGEVVNKVVKDLSENAKVKGVELKVGGDEDTVVKADAGKVEQILFNIIGNSLKFTDKGSVKISIKPDGKNVMIEIVDTGMGIPLGNQGILFHKFQQAGSSTITRDGAKGTGLGLYISRLMAEGMGGKLELVKSEEGKGSVFGITLPIVKV